MWNKEKLTLVYLLTMVDKSPIADRSWIADKIGGVDSNLHRWNMKYNIWYMCLNETDWNRNLLSNNH